MPVKRPKHLFQPGQSGNPKGRAPRPPEVKEALLAAGNKGILRMKALLDDDTAWGKNGWLDAKDQIKLAEVAIGKAWGPAVVDPRYQGPQGKPTPEDQLEGIGMGHMLRQVYEALKAEGEMPEFINAKRADLIDVTPKEEGEDGDMSE